MNGKRKLLSTLFATALLAACGSGGAGAPSGTYTGGMGSITFTSDAADVKLGPATREMGYSVNGNKIVLHSLTEGDIVLTSQGDGSLDTPWGHMRHVGNASATVANHAYRSANDKVTVTFAAGKMTMTMTGDKPGARAVTFTAPYTESGNKLTVQGPGGQVMYFTREADGSITLPGGKEKLIPVN